MKLLEEYGYLAVTVFLTGDMHVIWERFCRRDESPDRHRGHVVNSCYPEDGEPQLVKSQSYEEFVHFVTVRGMDGFRANGPRITLDMTDLSAVDMEDLIRKIEGDTYPELKV